MLIASVIFALAGPWNKAVTQKVDSFTVSCLNLGVGGAALLVIGLVLGGSLHPQSFGAVPVLLFLAFISGARRKSVTVHTPLSREVFWHEYAKIPRHTSQNSIAAGNLE